MSVGTYALANLDEAKAYIGNVPQRDGLWLYCSASDATAATVTVSDTTLTLVITGGTSAATTAFTLANASYDTLGELVTAIAAVAGWAAGRLYATGAASTDLLPTGSLSCLGAANQVTLKIEDNYLIEKLIDRATDYLERYCGRNLKSRDYTREIHDGNGQPRLMLRNWPVSRVSRLSIGRTAAFYVTNTTAVNTATVEITPTLCRLVADAGTATEITLADYATINLLIAKINTYTGWTATLISGGTRKATDVLVRPALSCMSPDQVTVEIPDDDLTDFHLVGGPSTTVSSAVEHAPNQGILYYSAGFPAGTQNILVNYTAGYATVPYALEMACLELVKYKYDMSKRDRSVMSEKLGDYSYAVADMRAGDIRMALPADLLEEINQFRNYEI